jgi:hypothetical protein
MKNAFSFLMLAGALVACGQSNDSTACAPNDVRACSCPDGTAGTQTCRAAGDGYGACLCASAGDAATDSSGVPGDADDNDVTGTDSDATADADQTDVTEPDDATSDGAPEAASGLPFAASCAVNGDCESGLCYSYPSKGMRCTMSCGSPAECPASSPAPGCNPKGICSVP